MASQTDSLAPLTNPADWIDPKADINHPSDSAFRDFRREVTTGHVECTIAIGSILDVTKVETGGRA